MQDEKEQDELTERLWAIVNELCSINEYEYPYRIPKLQQKADRLFASFDGAEVEAE